MKTRSPTALIRRLAVVIAVVAVIASACGDGDGDKTAKPSDTTRAAGAAAPGVTDDSVLFCSSLPLSGAFGLIGTPQQVAIDSYFQMVNDDGGVHGRRIEWNVYDDAFDGAKGVANVKRCVGEDKAFALGPGWNAFTVSASIAYLEQAKVPWLFSDGSTGDQYASEWIFPRGNFCDALSQDITDRLIVDAGAKRLGVIYINNELGQFCLAASQQVAEELGAEIVEAASVEDDTADYTPVLTRMRQAEVDAILVHGAPTETVKTLAAAQRQSYTPAKGYACSGGCALQITLQLAGEYSNGLLSSSPLHTTEGAPEGAVMVETIQKYHPDQADFDVFTKAGWTYAKMLVAALEANGPDLTRESLMETLRAGKWDDGFSANPVTFDPPKPITTFLPIEARDGKWVETGEFRDIRDKYPTLVPEG